jgi:hypothetical protein
VCCILFFLVPVRHDCWIMSEACDEIPRSERSAPINGRATGLACCVEGGFASDELAKLMSRFP